MLGFVGDETFANPEEVVAVKETPQGLKDWSADNEVFGIAQAQS